MVEAVRYKLCGSKVVDDLQWPLITSTGSHLPSRSVGEFRKSEIMFDDLDSEEDDHTHDHGRTRSYWEHILRRYQAQLVDPSQLSSTTKPVLPSNWTVININVTEDKTTMFISRQCANRTPIIVCLPLKGRRDNQEDEQLAFSDALDELREIIQLSDEGTRRASEIDKDDKAARAAWWGARSALDGRLRALLDNIEFCWLGAFKVRINVSDLIMRLNMIQTYRLYSVRQHVSHQKISRPLGCNSIHYSGEA